MFSQLNKPLIMGILNVTPDSFSDGGDFADAKTDDKANRKMLGIV